jgi:NADP-dependent aldehyde dehydrogenase
VSTSISELNHHVEGGQLAHEAARGAAPAVRAGWLDAVATGLEANADELVTIADEESHLGSPRLPGELRRTIFQLRLLADEVRDGHYLAASIDHDDDGWGMGPRPDLRRVNEPLGVVGVFGASNFPFAFSVIGGDSASALASGNAVVHKAHEAHPRLARRTAEIVVAALRGAGAPDGLFSLIEGRDAAAALVQHPLVQAVGFTGSTAGGRALFDLASSRPSPIPFFGELGSTNPVFVTERAWAARREQILAGFAGSMTLGMGQFCTKPGFLFVPSSDRAEVAEALGRAFAELTPTPMLSERLRASYGDVVDSLGETEGIDVLVAGDRAERPSPSVFATTADVIAGRPHILSIEAFGPGSVIVEYDDEAELPALASLLEGQLTASVHAEEGEDLGALVSQLSKKSGRVLWNGWPTGVTVSYSQQHGGPYPATTASQSTSVGTAAIARFVRPVAYQSFPGGQLPPPLRDDNPWGVPQRVDGEWAGA